MKIRSIANKPDSFYDFDYYRSMNIFNRIQIVVSECTDKNPVLFIQYVWVETETDCIISISFILWLKSQSQWCVLSLIYIFLRFKPHKRCKYPITFQCTEVSLILLAVNTCLNPELNRIKSIFRKQWLMCETGFNTCHNSDLKAGHLYHLLVRD